MQADPNAWAEDLRKGVWSECWGCNEWGWNQSVKGNRWLDEGVYCWCCDKWLGTLDDVLAR